MTIIATTKDGYIIAATKTELARLIGYYSEYTRKGSELAIGAEIAVSEMYDQLYKLRQLQGTLKSIVEKSRELQDCIKTKRPVLDAVSASIESVAPKDE